MSEAMLRGGLRYGLATAEDEPELRALLREPLPGWVALSFEREPDYFAGGAVEGERHGVVVAREVKSGRLAGFYARSVRSAFVNGEPRLLGYLGQLRVAREFRGGVHRIRHGFEAGRTLLRRPDELPFDLTSILGDNHRARRLLTAGLPGMPRYAPLAPLYTLVFRSRGGPLPSAVERGDAVGLAAIAECLQRNLRRFQCAPRWSAESLARSGLGAEDFLVVRAGAGVRACCSVWDLRGVKQTVVRGYHPPLGLLRPAINALAPLAGLPRLPPVGSVLRQGYLSHLTCDGDDQETARQLLGAARAAAHARGLDSLLLGLTADHPLTPALTRAGRHLTYASRLYLVHWPDAEPPALDGRPVQVELAGL